MNFKKFKEKWWNICIIFIQFLMLSLLTSHFLEFLETVLLFIQWLVSHWRCMNYLSVCIRFIWERYYSYKLSFTGNSNKICNVSAFSTSITWHFKVVPIPYTPVSIFTQVSCAATPIGHWQEVSFHLHRKWCKQLEVNLLYPNRHNFCH